MMIGAMTDLFPWNSGEKVGWVDVTAQPGQCSAAVLINRECIWGQHQQGRSLGTCQPHITAWAGTASTGALRWAVLAKPRPQLWTGSGATAGKGGSCQPSPLGAAGVGCAKARAFVPGRDAWVAAGGKCTPSKARDHLQPGICLGALQPTERLGPGTSVLLMLYFSCIWDHSGHGAALRGQHCDPPASG